MEFSSERYNILIVDDHAENLLALEAILSNPQYNLIRAGSGKEALMQILKNDFAVILLDVMMPGMDGFELASLIKQREQSKSIPIIFLTAVAKELFYIQKGYEVGAVDYLPKPLNPDLVRAKVAIFVDLYRKTQKIIQQNELLRKSEQIEKEYQLAKEKLKSEKKYRNLAESIPQILWTTGVDGKISYCNSRWTAFTGLDEQHGKGWLGFIEVVHPADKESCTQKWEQAFKEGTPFEYECRLKRFDGVYHWHLCRALPEWDSNGQILGWIGTLTEIQVLKEIQEELEEKGKELQKAIKVREEFLTIASHELKTPLTPLKIQTQSLFRLVSRSAADLPRDRLVRTLRSIDGQVERLTHLVEELLDISKIDAGKLPMKFEEFDLTLLIHDIVNRFSDQFREGQSPLKVEASGPLIGIWDKYRVEQIIVNLITNALKYGSGNSVEIRVSQNENQQAEVAVQDHGIGIQEQDLDRIFNRFERAVSSSNYGGMGLGLFIVRQNIDAHQGQIFVQSHPGAGACFKVNLPLRPDNTVNAAA